jgi:hypothetical protein
MATIESRRAMGWFGNLMTKALYGQSDEELRARYQIEAGRMFRCRVVKELPEMDLVEMVVELSVDSAGGLGVIVAVGYRSRAVHEINKDGSFSKGPPYWTRKNWRPCDPRRYAQCLLFQAKRPGNPMKPVREQILHVGHEVLDFDSKFRPFQTFETWKLLNARGARP